MSDSNMGLGDTLQHKFVQSDINYFIAIALWFFLGGLGAHRFYLGKIKSGIGMLALLISGFVLSFVFVGIFLIAALGIWWVVDGVLMIIALGKRQSQ